MVGDFFGAAQVFYVGFQDAVEDAVIGEGVLIALVGAKFGGGRLGDGFLRDHFPFAIYEIGEGVDHGFGDVGDYGEAAGHVSVQRAVAHRHFGFVSGAEDHGAEFVGKRHEQVAADAGLNVFFGGVFGLAGENGRESFAVVIESVGDRQGDEFDSEIVGELAGVTKAAFG